MPSSLHSSSTSHERQEALQSSEAGGLCGACVPLENKTCWKNIYCHALNSWSQPHCEHGQGWWMKFLQSFKLKASLAVTEPRVKTRRLKTRVKHSCSSICTDSLEADGNQGDRAGFQWGERQDCQGRRSWAIPSPPRPSTAYTERRKGHMRKTPHLKKKIVLLVTYFIHISVYVSIPISQFIPPPPHHLPPLVKTPHF